MWHYQSAAACGRLAVVALVCCTPVSGQAPTFEAASVRPTEAKRPGGDLVFLPGGQLRSSNEVVVQLIAAAYNVPTFRIVGGPDWIRTEGFDIQARGEATATMDHTRLMLRTLLADRFMLRVRTETRDVPIYSLVLARADGRTGPRLRRASPAACADRGPQPIGGQPGDLPPCGRLFENPGRFTGRSVSPALLATRLSSIAGRVVVDRTGLTGLFDVDAEWGLTEAQYAEFVQQLPPGVTPRPFDASKPSLFTALEEQLAVRLQSATGPVEVVAIDSVERPTAN
jgi:uncharacterized protein (TIGR03435 family)